jgi:hypothetical protein
MNFERYFALMNDMPVDDSKDWKSDIQIAIERINKEARER